MMNVDGECDDDDDDCYSSSSSFVSNLAGGPNETTTCNKSQLVKDGAELAYIED